MAEGASHRARSRLSSLKLISKAVIYFNYDYLSVEPAAHRAHSPFTMTGKWTRQADSQRKRGREVERKEERRSMAAVGQLIVLHFPPITVQLFSLPLTLFLSLFCPWFVQNCCAFNYCDYCGNSLQFSIVATTPRLATPSQAKPCSKKKKQFSSKWIAWIS